MRWWVASVVLIGCGHEHVAFPPPPPNLTPQQRVYAYNQLVGEQEHIVVSNQGNGSHSIIMADGREVYYPEDLVPLVLSDSATARHARNAEAARDSSGLWKMGGFVVLLVGMGAWFAHAAEENPSGPNIVGPVLMLTGLVGLGVSFYYSFHASHE